MYAQSWPQRPVSVVVPQPAGNSPDVLCRVIAEKLSRALGQQFVVENRAGAANLVGTQAVARAAPDGYTFLFATSAALVMNPYTFKKLAYDPIKDFTPVAMVARSNHVLLVNPEVKAKTLAGIDRARKVGTGLAEHGCRRPAQSLGPDRTIHQQAGRNRLRSGPLQYDHERGAGQHYGTRPGDDSSRIDCNVLHHGRHASTHCRCGQQAHRFVAGRAGHLGNAEKRGPARLVHVDGAGRHAHRHRRETQCRDCARSEFSGSTGARPRPRLRCRHRRRGDARRRKAVSRRTSLRPRARSFRNSVSSPNSRWPMLMAVGCVQSLKASFPADPAARHEVATKHSYLCMGLFKDFWCGPSVAAFSILNRGDRHNLAVQPIEPVVGPGLTRVAFTGSRLSA